MTWTWRAVRLAALTSLGACGFSLSPGTGVDAGGDGTRGDAAPEDGPRVADAMPDAMIPATWSAPQLLGIDGADPTLTADLLQIWFIDAGDISHASRTATTSPFGAASPVLELSQAASESSPEVSADGSTMMFARFVGNNDVYTTTWSSGVQSWSVPSSILDLNTADHEQSGSISTDGQQLALTRLPPGGTSDIYISTMGAGGWSNPIAAASLNSPNNDSNAVLRGDKLAICFDSTRNGAATDIYCATRSAADQPFDAPVAIAEVNSPQNDQDPWLSPDGKVMVFWSDRGGVGHLYISTHP